jgi:murein DD-endopeptidase MepM/ murein hydrolase activator NlpD
MTLYAPGNGRRSSVGAGRALVVLLALSWGAAGCAIPRWPVQGPVSSDFGLRFQGVWPGIHRGIDIAVPTGTEIRTMAPGVVRFAGVQSGYGNVVWVDHGGEVLTVYAHLSAIHVAVGQVVRSRAVLGLSGASGNASGPHLHFEVWRWGRERDPVPLLGGFPSRR